MREREDVLEQNRELKKALSATCSALRSFQYGNGAEDLARRIADMGERILAGCGGVEPAARASSEVSRTEVSEGRR